MADPKDAEDTADPFTNRIRFLKITRKLILTASGFTAFFKKYWFMLALLAVFVATLADASAILAGWGAWLKQHHAPDLVIVLIFLFSGITLSMEQLTRGLSDVKGLMMAFAVIFVAAPLAALALSLVPMETGIVIGLFLVAIMPSTLSSGVVMTAAAGGNPGHALVTTLCANIVSVFTIPYVLSVLLMFIGASASVVIDKGGIMLKIGCLVVLPLLAGMVLRRLFPSACKAMGFSINIINQGLIIFVVWMATSQTREVLMAGGWTAGLIICLVFVFHGVLLAAAWFLIRLSKRRQGRRESILFMGSQKTLPLSVILQMSLFPQYGLALLVCVLHHIVHLMMDAYLVQRLRAASSKPKAL